MSSVAIETVTECQDWLCSITCFYVSTCLVSLIELTELGPVLGLDLISLRQAT